MNPVDLVSDLQRRGIHLWVDGDRLRFRAPRGVLTAEHRELLVAHKPAVIDHLTRDQAALRVTADPGAVHEPFPLTPVQSAYLIGRNHAYAYGGVACTSYLEIDYAAVEPDRVEAAWNELVRRHDMLRATVHGDGYQRIHPQAPHYRIPVTDARGEDAAALAAQRDRRRDAMLSGTRSSEQWPLFDLHVTRTDRGSILHLLVELLVLDAASVQQLLAELDDLVYGRSNSRPAPAIGFRDYVLGVQRLRNGSRYHRDRDYWQRRLDDLPPAPALPVDALDVRFGTETGSDSGTGEFDRHHRVLTSADLAGLAGHAAAHGLTASGAVLTAYAEVIGRWSRHRRFTLNLPVFNRLPVHADIDTVLGDFTSVSLLGIDLDDQDTFTDRARAITTQLFTDLDHRLFDGVEVLGELTRRAGAPVLMPVVYTSTLGAEGDAFPSTERGRILRGMTRTPQVWLDCQVTPHEDGLLLAWDVRRGVLPGDTAADAFAAFADLVTDLARAPGTWSARYPVPLPTAQQVRRDAYDATAVDRTPRLLHQRILDRAATHPDAPAVIHPTGTLDFAALARRAAATAIRLREAGVERGQRVAIVMEKGPEQVVAALAALLAGAAYVPIEAAQPAARRERILGRAGAGVVLTQSWLHAAGEPPAAVPAILVDEVAGDDGAPDLAGSADPVDPAYVIYTSGSTGEPKGVVVTHHAAANTLDDLEERFAVGPGDRVLGLANLSFDLSVFDIFGVLAAGGALVLPEAARAADPSHWADLIQRHAVTVWNSVPGQLQMLQDFLDSAPGHDAGSLRLALVSGDWIPLDLPGRVHAKHPGLSVVGLGGATEAAIWSIHHPVGEVDPRWRSIPYGTPLSNQTVHVFDGVSQDCPEHVTGELYIGGVGLAEGYLHDDELTAERFLRHPRTGARLYRTGDLGRFHPGGWIEFLGREDSQVKVRGHRVELGEIESALRRHRAVADAAVVLDAHGPGARLLGFAEIALDPSAPTAADPAGDRILEAAETAAATVRGEIDGESFEALMRAVDEVAVLSIAARLRADGLFRDAGRSYDIAEIATATGVSDRQSGLLARWMTALAHAGAVVHDPETGRYRDLVEADADMVEQRWRRIHELDDIVGYGRATLDYIRTCSTRLDELLRGDLDVRELLFPAGEFGAAHAVYRTNLVARGVHRVVIDTVRAIAARTPRRVRVLEVGGGIGGTSTDLIPALAEYEPDYHFTDLSEFFLSEARRTFADYPWMRYGRFDINTDAREQGLRPNSADVILCANVLHNSRNADEVLARLREILAPGGWLVFLEPTRQHNYALLVSMEFEFFSELATFTDVRAGTGQAFFTRDQWLRLLADAGADRVRALPADGDPLATSGQGVFIARFKGDRHALTEQQLTEHVAALLPGHMVPDQLWLLDALPRSANGKLDRAALAARTSHDSGDGEVAGFVAPADGLEQRIAHLWTEMLGVERVGRDQDFYALGGDSLLLSRMIGRLREREAQAAAVEWQELLRHMLRDATVAGLAAQLRRPDAGVAQAESASALLPLGGDEADPAGTWVLVHGGTGTLQPYHALIPHLRAAHPGALVGLQAPDLSRYLELPPESVITRMAADYATELLDGDHHGRFRIIGYCVGGLLATEIGRILTEAGAVVDELTVISSYQPPAVDDEVMVDHIFALAVGADLEDAGFPGDADAFGAAVRTILDRSPDRIPRAALASLDGPHAPLAAKFRDLSAVPRAERIAALHTASTGGSAYNSGGHALDEFRRLFDVFAQSLRAVAAHRPEPYLGPVRLLRNSESSTLLPGTREDVGEFWSRICLGPLAVEDIPGDHFGCMAAAHSSALGGRITAPVRGSGVVVP
ncbi:non-ribosomal peptide synthetase [Nocardia thraciensis]